MNNKQSVIQSIENIINLLEEAEEDYWLKIFIAYRKKCDCDAVEELKDLRSEILTIYSGMGSFNDLVLYKKGQLLIEENQKLDELSTELYEMLVDR